jgi:nucleoside-diphosphate-sugar epimerase
MRVAITGVSGLIGSAIAGRLAQAGHAVTGLVRASSRRDHVAAHVDRFVVGHHDDESVWPELLDGAECLVHNSVDWEALKEADPSRHERSNLLGALRLLDASAPRRFIFMSSIAVHHDMRPRFGGVIDEDHPTRPGSRYGAYKAAVEAHLWALHFAGGRSFVALRPCAVYGIDPKLERSIGYPIVEQLRRERAYRRPGGGKFVHVEDVATAALGAVEARGTVARVVNLADCYARWGDLARMASEILGLDGRTPSGASSGAVIDLSSPPEPQNRFTKDAARALGASLDRGHDGLRTHLAQLVRAMG